MKFFENKHLFSFLYGEKSIWDCDMETRITEKGNETVTEFVLPDGLKITNIVKKHANHAYEWVNWFENLGKEPTKIISELWDCDCELPFEKDESKRGPAYVAERDEMTRVFAPTGSSFTDYEFFSNPYDMGVENNPPYLLTPDSAHKSFKNIGGRSSDGRAPFFNIHRQGKGVIIAIGWSGQWQCDLDRTDYGVRIRTKIEDTHFKLLPGEKIRTSSVVIMPYEGKVVESQNQWRRLVRSDFSLIGKPGRDKEGVFCTGLWGGMSDTAIFERIEAIKKNKLMFDDIWMDAGWYGTSKEPSPSEFEGDWWAHVGDWRPNPYLHPNEMDDVAKEIKEADMKFLLWFEPERCYHTAPIVKEHPEFMLMPKNEEDGSRLFNLGNDEAWQYCFETLSGIIERYDLHYYRQDFNTCPLPFWRKNDTEERIGITEIKHIMGLYKLWDALLERFPHLMIDNCAGGGRRIDIETMRRSIPLWRSDAQCPANYNPEISQMHNLTFSSWLPYSGTGMGRIWGDDYRARSSYAGALTTNFFYSESDQLKDDPQEFEWIKKMSKEYLKARPYFYEDFYPLTQVSDRSDIWSVAQYHRPNPGDGIVQVFRRENSPYTDSCFNLGGIDPEKTYVFSDADSGECFEISGSELLQKGFNVHIEKKRCAKLYFYHAK